MILAAVLLLNACGYTTQSLLSQNAKTIYIAPVKNAVDISSEVTDKNPFRPYRPGLEVDLTNAIINRFIFDGNLKIASQDKADLRVEASVVDYRRDALRYTEGDDVQEYRLSVTVEVQVIQKENSKALWSERVTGDTSYFLSGSRAKTEDEAAAVAVEDLARRVVEKTIEVW